jgi:predicted Zn finger-like uncharacterized protein
MRLICPNCGAQYEVADDVIPPLGRDVQCSNCSHTWFESPGASEEDEFALPPEPAPQPTPPPPMAPRTFTRPESPVVRTPMPKPLAERVAAAPEVPPAPEPAPEPPATFADVLKEPAAPPTVTPRAPMRNVPPEVAEILREEAAREEAARKAEAATGIETQPELGLEHPTERDDTDDLRRRIEKMRAEADAMTITSIAPTPLPPAPTIGTAPSRRDLLPDIEEINSTLRSANERGPVAEETARAEATNRRGFRFGFSLVLLLAAALATVYVFTPRIIVIVPEAAPILTTYANAVDDARLWLDLGLQQVLDVIAPDEADAPATTAPASGG